MYAGTRTEEDVQASRDFILTRDTDPTLPAANWVCVWARALNDSNILV